MAKLIKWPRTIRREEEVRRILSFAPSNLIDLLFNLERFEVIELGLVRLELGVELVFAALLLMQPEGCMFNRRLDEKSEAVSRADQMYTRGRKDGPCHFARITLHDRPCRLLQDNFP
jgi:hypothetical protein